MSVGERIGGVVDEFFLVPRGPCIVACTLIKASVAGQSRTSTLCGWVGVCVSAGVRWMETRAQADAEGETDMGAPGDRWPTSPINTKLYGSGTRALSCTRRSLVQGRRGQRLEKASDTMIPFEIGATWDRRRSGACETGELPCVSAQVSYPHLA